MGITANFLKLRSSGTPKTGEWNINYTKALDLAKKNGKFIVTCWSNGDMCSYCTQCETCMMQQVFKDWMKTADAYFVFQYSGDPDEGNVLYDWIFTKTKLNQFPGFRITLYDKSNPSKILFDTAITGNALRANKINVYGAKEMIAKLNSYFAKGISCSAGEYKVRLNEKLSTKQINKVLDSLDANKGYCPCQPKSAKTKCHCEDFVKNKSFGEPCICQIYVKQPIAAPQKKNQKRKQK